MKERSLVKLTPVSEELNIVKILFEKYLELKSLSKLETFTLQSNIKTKRGGRYGKASLKTILNNTVYVKTTDKVLEYLENKGINVYGESDGKNGILTYNKNKIVQNDEGKTITIARDTEEWIAAVSSQKGIIEADDWLKVQEILAENKDKFPNEGKTHNALLTGILKCSKCGSPMWVQHGHISKKTGKTIYYYKCGLKKRSKGSLCDCKNASVADVDTVVIEYLKEMARNKKEIISNMLIKTQENKVKVANTNKDFMLKEQIKNKEIQVDNLVNKLSLDEDISDILIIKIKQLKNELSKIREELKNIEDEKTSAKEIEVNLYLIDALLDKCSMVDTLDAENKKQLIEGLLTNIIWNPDNYSLEIDFIGNADELKKN